MNQVSKKCRYALRAVFELARGHGGNPLSVGDIADAQDIPPRFLSTILVELRNRRIVESFRGARGGYTLCVDPQELSVGRIIRIFDGSLCPVDCLNCGGREACKLQFDCVFAPLWLRSRQLLADLYNSTSFADLVEGRLADRHTFEATADSLPTIAAFASV